MYLVLVLVASSIWILRRYCGVILSWILSILFRCSLEVGEVHWCAVSNIKLRWRHGFVIRIDALRLTFFPQGFSKPLALSVGDVRIECDADAFQPNSATKSTRSIKLTTALQILQYCGLSINRVQVILFDVISDCVVHVTVDELCVEAFRSREGWQVELSCRLGQGKAMRRSNSCSLLDFALSFELSVDFVGGAVHRMSLRLAEPSLSISNDAVDYFVSLVHSEEQPPEYNDKAVSASSFMKAPQLEVIARNSSVKYNVDNRYVLLTLREVNVAQNDVLFDARFDNICLTNDSQSSTVRSAQVSCSMKCETAKSVSLTTESVTAALCVDDLVWWRQHLLTTTIRFDRRSEKSTNMSPLDFSLEVAMFSCDLVDHTKYHSNVRVHYLSLQKTGASLELAFEQLSLAPPALISDSVSFEKHNFGHSVYIGVAVVQLSTEKQSILMCVDDLKLEWSDALGEQAERILATLARSAVENNERNLSERHITLKAEVKMCAFVLTAKEQTYVLTIFDELSLESEKFPTDFSIAAKNLKIGLDQITSPVLDVMELRRAAWLTPPADDGLDIPRVWSQQQVQERKAARRQAFEVMRSSSVKVVADTSCISLSHVCEATTRQLSIATHSEIYVMWSPLLHRVLFHAYETIKRVVTSAKRSTTSEESKSREMHLKLNALQTVTFDMELPRLHRWIWRSPSLSLTKSPTHFTVGGAKLSILMNGYEVITATNVCVSRVLSDATMTEFRRALPELDATSNKTWTWSAESCLFHLPFQFSFAEVFEEFINCIKWIKLVHDIRKKPFTAESPLPCDIRVIFKEFILEMEDDPFENRLQLSNELKEDEVFECERRRQMLAERLSMLQKSNPLLPQSKVDELYESLRKKNSEIYIERWHKAGNVRRSLFVCHWKGFQLRSFADMSLHGTDACVTLMHRLDPLSYFPTDGLRFSTLWARSIELDIANWTMTFKDYPLPYLQATDMHFFGTLVGAEQFEEGGRSMRDCTIPLPQPWQTLVVQRNMAPLKFYYDIQCESDDFRTTYGPCWEPCLTMISLTWNNISAPSRDPSPPLPFWDKMRFLLHGRYSWLSKMVVTSMLASPDPYNDTETVEMCWEDLGLDWELGEIRINAAFSVYMRTASRYDDIRIVRIPDLRLRVSLDWICAGDAHDHHSVVICAPSRVPHFSTDHDSYRAFRSSCVDWSLSLEASASACDERVPHMLMYSNTFRCIEFLVHTLTMKNRNVRKGKLFSSNVFIKPQFSKHFRTVQVSVALPRFYVAYWMSHSSNYGFRLTSDGLVFSAAFRLSITPPTDTNIRRRKNYTWSAMHMSASLGATQVHVFGSCSREEADEMSDDTFLFGLSRLNYVRENKAGRDTAVHRLTINDLKAQWTAANRDACLSIADGIQRAHLLRRILSNDAIKILNLHIEEDLRKEEQLQPKETTSTTDKGHRRGYSLSDNQSMLHQLIGEAHTKRIAHCEQASELPTNSLLGVQQCTGDDVQLINWQIDLLNSQLALKGCEQDGFLLLTSSRASLCQKIHRPVWRESQLLGKKSWSSIISGMQYFAPMAMADAKRKAHFRWLPLSVVEERSPDSQADDHINSALQSGDAVGGTVDLKLDESPESGVLQLQRIVARCSCEMYFCYFSEQLKAESLEVTALPKADNDHVLDSENNGIDCLTLKHNMMEAISNSEQYEMAVDIVNNLVLFVDPKKKELAERRRRLRFEGQMKNLEQMRDEIVQQQMELREIVSMVRSLERQLYYLEHNQEADTTLPNKRSDILEEMEEYKDRQLQVSDQLAIYISCYQQRQVEAKRLGIVKNRIEDDEVVAVVRRFEVCFEDCIWSLTASDGQSVWAQVHIRNFLYTRTNRIDNSCEHLFEVGTIRVTNLLPNSLYKDALHRLHRDETDKQATNQPAVRLILKDVPPVGGISVKEHLELNISPMVVQLTYRFFETLMIFFFPGRNIHKDDTVESVEEQGKFSFTRHIAGTLSMRSTKNVERKGSTVAAKEKGASLKPSAEVGELDDMDRMRERAYKNNFFVYVKIPDVPFVVSYKGNKDKNIEDVDRFNFLFPICEFRNVNLTWLDLLLQIKKRCKNVLVQQFMKQKLLRNRLMIGGQEPVEGVSEEDKKRIALGNANSAVVDKKRRK